MKKSAIILAAIFSIIISASLVLGAVPLNLPAPELPGDYGQVLNPVAKIVKGAIDGIAATSNYVLGGAGFADNSLAKLLLFILVSLVLFGPSKKLVGEDKKGLAWAVSIIVSILGVFWIPKEIITTILLPYNTLGVIVATFIPLALLFYFINDSLPNKYMRRAAWTASCFVLLGLWIIRSGETGANVAFNIVYLIAALLVIAIIFTDKWWRVLFIKTKSEGSKNKILLLEKAEYLGQRAQREAELAALPKIGMTEARNALKEEIGAFGIEIKRLDKALGK